MTSGKAGRLDVLVVTAVPDEYAAVLAVATGAAVGSRWEVQKAATGLDVAVRDFVGDAGALRVGVTQALGMGGANAVMAAAELLKEHDARCLAMCGVCAGRRGEVELGDVIIADRVWQYDMGKRKVEVMDGRRVVREQGDVDTYQIRPLKWKQAAERFELDERAAWLASRPRSYEAQGDWILERVLRGGDPVTDADSKAMCGDLDKVLTRLWQKKLLKKHKLVLTGAGKKHIEHVLLVNRNRLPDAKPLKVHVGPIASGNKVMQDDDIFPLLSDSVRKVLGVEMEVAAVGMLAHAKGLPYFVAMKAVMDFADADKSDNFKVFAARTSAEVLIAFVRQHVPPQGREGDPVLTPGTSPLPPRAGPAALLNARHEVVPFHGRGELLEEMRGWCESEDKVRARLTHAAGGMGKTRLAIELCRQMREEGWHAGFLAEGDPIAELMESERPALAVIDYAESRQGLRDILKRVAPHESKQESKKQVRILLLARNADEWWTDLMRSDGFVKDLLCQEGPVELPSMTVDKEAIFREAVSAFAKREYDGTVPNLNDARYKRVLYVHAAALATAQGREVEVEALMEDTLDHEERFWREHIDRADVDDMRRVTAALTLRGGGDSAAEVRALVELICGAPHKKMSLLLRDLYPGRAPKYVSGIEPDLLGEAMVWRALRNEGRGVEPYLDCVFDSVDADAIRAGFIVLGRLSEDHKEAEGWIARVLDRDVVGRAMEAFAAARSVGERTAHAAIGIVLARALECGGTIDLAKRLEDVLPEPGEAVSLLEVGQWVTQTRLKYQPESDEPNALAERARLFSNLGSWQSDLGDATAALASGLQAVGVCRHLVSLHGDMFEPNLASSLNNLGLRARAVGDRQLALDAARTAVRIYRRLYDARPHGFGYFLAMSLCNLSNAQGEFEQYEDALVSIQEAVDRYRSLSEQRSDYLPNLAKCTHNLGACQSNLGRCKEALVSTREAAVLYRRLAQTNPDAFLPDLALVLSNLSVDQAALDDIAALASAQEAVTIRRRLAESRPNAFLPDLAASLHNLSLWQDAVGQHEEALAAEEEALDAIWPFFCALPSAHERLAGLVLDNHRKVLAALRRPPTPDLLQRLETFAVLRRVPDDSTSRPPGSM